MSLQSSIAGSLSLAGALLQQPSSPLGNWNGIVMMVVVMGIFYVVAILPTARQRKALQKAVDAIKKGDKVITTGGMYGEVSAVEGAKVLLRVADSVRIWVAKAAIAGFEGDGDKSDKGDKGSAS